MPDLHIVRPSTGETPPTWDAYNAACAALEKHRRRADDAEAEVARLRRELAWQTGSDPFCHEVRDGDTVPCPERPGESHVDESGREWGYHNNYADEGVSGCG